MSAQPNPSRSGCTQRDNADWVPEGGEDQLAGQKCERNPPTVQVAAHARHSQSGSHRESQPGSRRQSTSELPDLGRPPKRSPLENVKAATQKLTKRLSSKSATDVSDSGLIVRPSAPLQQFSSESHLCSTTAICSSTSKGGSQVEISGKSTRRPRSRSPSMNGGALSSFPVSMSSNGTLVVEESL